MYNTIQIRKTRDHRVLIQGVSKAVQAAGMIEGGGDKLNDYLESLDEYIDGEDYGVEEADLDAMMP